MRSGRFSSLAGESLRVERVLNALEFHFEAVAVGEFFIESRDVGFGGELFEVVFCRHVLHDVCEHVADVFEGGFLGHGGIVRGGWSCANRARPGGVGSASRELDGEAHEFWTREARGLEGEEGTDIGRGEARG